MSLRACNLLLAIVIFLPYLFPVEGAHHEENINSNIRDKQLEGLNSSRTIAKNGRRQRSSSSCQCGLSNPLRIIGGDKIDLPRKYPWLVYIQIKTVGNFYHQCTGSLISSGHVLTAAHCVHDGNKWLPSKGVSVFIGDHNVYENDDDIPEETLVMKARIIKHPKFDYETSDYDIVLLELENQVDLNEFELVRPICLPESTRSKYFKKQAISAGWGVTNANTMNTPDTPYELVLKTTNKKCLGYTVTNNQICTVIRWEKKSPFLGDSGGPLMVEEDGRYIQIGLLSGGQTRSDKKGSRGVGVFTSVAKLLGWISKRIKNDRKCV